MNDSACMMNSNPLYLEALGRDSIAVDERVQGLNNWNGYI
jgi:hypothetical protein